MIRRRTSVLAACLLLTTGCSGDSDDSAVSSPSPTVVAEPSAGSDPSAEPDTELGDTSDAIDMGNLSECAATKWLVLADQIDNVFDQTALATMDGFDVVVEGEGLVDLRADGTYTYSPEYSIEITVAGQSGTGEWGGSLDGTWRIVGDQLTMAQTDNSITGTMTILGQTQPLPQLSNFNGNATILECTPVTMKYELDTPVGPATHTLVVAE